MAQTIPTSEPAIIVAGDTLAWTKSLPDYPASEGWQLSYRLINATGKIDITSAADGDEHAITVAATTTAAYTPGVYTWQSAATKAAERYTVATGAVTIKPNLAAQAGGYEARSVARKALDDTRNALALWIASNGQVQEYEIAGRRMKYASAEDIIQRINLLEREVAREDAAERLAAGQQTGRTLYVRF